MPVHDRARVLLAVAEKLHALLNEGRLIPLTPSKFVAAQLSPTHPGDPPGPIPQTCIATDVHSDDPYRTSTRIANPSQLTNIVNCTGDDAGVGCVTLAQRSGVGVEPTQPWATRPDRL